MNYYDEVITKLNRKEIFELVENISNGLPVSTPVFDGASTDDITKMLNLSKLPSSGQTTLWDGITGEKTKCNEAIYTFVAVNEMGKPTKVPSVTPETELEKLR